MSLISILYTLHGAECQAELRDARNAAEAGEPVTNTWRSLVAALHGRHWETARRVRAALPQGADPIADEVWAAHLDTNEGQAWAGQGEWEGWNLQREHGGRLRLYSPRGEVTPSAGVRPVDTAARAR